MPAYEVILDAKAADAGIKKVLGKFGKKEIGQVIGAHVANLVQAHLMRYNKEHPNALGGPRTNYYAKAAKSTHWQTTGDGVKVSVPHVGIGLLYYGGTVRPGKGISSKTGKPTRRLTIPAIAAAHGKSAAEFNDLVPLYGKKGPYALAHKGTKTVVFWLAKKATIGPHKDLLPTTKQVKEAMREGVEELVVAAKT